MSEIETACTPGIVIVGAGQAATTLAASLRTGGYDGSITLIGEESVPPYQRPPLSKSYILGDTSVDRLHLKPHQFYVEANITLRLGELVSSIDPDAKTVTVGDTALPYTHLALTTGASPVPLPEAIGGSLEGVHLMRTLRDADLLASRFDAGEHALIVGGGYIGLEAAAVLRAKGFDVTLVEAATRILQRVAAHPTSEAVRELHRRRGVVMIEGAKLDRLEGIDGKVRRALLSDGRTLPADIVVVGIGVRPRIELAQAAGLVIDNGVATDAFGRTSAPGIWAAGDCASIPWRGRRLRVESVGNAIATAEVVAANILGAERPFDTVPWFWSDQFDAKLQIVGIGDGYDRIVTRRGAGDSVSFWYFAEGSLIAVDAINDARAYMTAKRLLDRGQSPDPDAVADPSTDLKSLLGPPSR
ncbi:MAG: FAD-dependent oxidoreductase [Devosia sp.]